MKILSVFLQIVFFAFLSSVVSAQDSSSSANEDFESYERNFSQVSTSSKQASAKGGLSINPTAKPPRQAAVKTQKKPTPPRTNPVNKTKPSAAATNVGLPGMKIWLEKQTNCDGAFLTVAPASIFRTGDCVRVRFRLNFEGYLTVINRGSSGSIDQIYPLKNQNNKVFPKTDNFIPDNRGWEFYNEAGNENLFFIISNLPLKGDSHREIENQEVSNNDSAQPAEVYDRDLKPRTEKNEIFVLASETRLEKPLVFRLTLKHR